MPPTETWFDASNRAGFVVMTQVASRCASGRAAESPV